MILISCKFWVICSKFDPFTFSEVPKTGFFESVLAFYSIRAVTTLTLVDLDSPKSVVKKILAIQGFGPISMAIRNLILRPSPQHWN